MKHDREPGVGLGDAGRRDTTGAAGTPWGVYVVVLVGIVILIAVGLADLLSMGTDGPSLRAPAAVASAVDPTIALETAASSPEAPHVPLEDIATVDLRTGIASDLPRSIRKILGASHFRVSPDGTAIAFDDGGSIFVANIDWSHVRRFTPDEGGVSAPSWSPEGSRLVFSEGSFAFILDIDTGHITRLVRERWTIWYPNFSPDGETVLYTTVRRRAMILKTIPATGGPSSRLTRGAFGAYSPDGKTVAFRKTQFDGIDVTEMTAGTLWLADANGSHVRGLAHCGCWMSHIDLDALWPNWSSDGSMIAYQPLYESPIRVVDVRSGHLWKVGEGVDPSWLDDHTLIITLFQGIGTMPPTKIATDRQERKEEPWPGS